VSVCVHMKRTSDQQKVAQGATYPPAQMHYPYYQHPIQHHSHHHQPSLPPEGYREPGGATTPPAPEELQQYLQQLQSYQQQLQQYLGQKVPTGPPNIANAPVYQVFCAYCVTICWNHQWACHIKGQKHLNKARNPREISQNSADYQQALQKVIALIQKQTSTHPRTKIYCTSCYVDCYCTQWETHLKGNKHHQYATQQLNGIVYPVPIADNEMEGTGTSSPSSQQSGESVLHSPAATSQPPTDLGPAPTAPNPGPSQHVDRLETIYANLTRLLSSCSKEKALEIIASSFAEPTLELLSDPNFVIDAISRQNNQ